MDYQFGDMTVRYTEDQEGHIGLLLFPGECPVEKLPEKRQLWIRWSRFSLQEISITEDMRRGRRCGMGRVPGG